MIGIVTGLALEAACFDTLPAHRRPRVRCDGMGPARAGRAARRLLADGCAALCSFGIAGGLDPELRTATAVLADAVITTSGRRSPTDAAWRERLRPVLAAALEVTTAGIIGSDRVIETPADKRRLFTDTGAAAVDMESHAVAAVAADAGVPLLVLRAVSDPAGAVIPPAAMAGVGKDGRTRHLAVAWALVWRPGDLPAVLRLRHDSALAVRTLRRVAVLAGPGFGFD